MWVPLAYWEAPTTFCARLAAVAPPALRSGHLELPTSHRLPLSWLLEAASPPIVYRAYAEVVPEVERDPARLEALRQSVLQYKPAQAIARKQKGTGLWARGGTAAIRRWGGTPNTSPTNTPNSCRARSAANPLKKARGRRLFIPILCPPPTSAVRFSDSCPPSSGSGPASSSGWGTIS